jgi:DNA-binding IclR family transcriptional regulator
MPTPRRRAPRSAPGAQALTRGLDVLRVVTESARPLGATEIAAKVGLHQSWVSRVLRALADAGYVRKPDYRSFAADYGALALGGNALAQFPLATRPRAAVRALAERAGMNVALATLWRGQLIYLMRADRGQELIPLAIGFPLHLSSIGLRLLLDLPRAEALELLAESRRRYGWDRPTATVPTTPAAALDRAKADSRHGCVVLEGWLNERHLGCAIPITAPGEPPSALAVSRTSGDESVERALLWLQEGRRDVEAALVHTTRSGAKA